MSYQIYNNGAFIRIVSESGERRVMKHFIVEVRAIDPERLKIDMGDGSKAIFINPVDVTVPGVPDATVLSYVINIMITDCVCGRVQTTPG